MRLCALRDGPGRAPHAATAPGRENASHRGTDRVHRGDAMEVIDSASVDRRYAKCIEVSKRIRWDIDRDVIRGRKFDFSRKFLPDGLTLMDQFEFLNAGERRLLSQVQGRTYANMFGLCERFIGAKVLEVSREHWFGDQTALEALV